MGGFKLVNILDILDDLGEETCRKILEIYSCPKNNEVEEFLRRDAIEFAKKQVTITYLLIKDDEKQLYLLGYFALTNKFIRIYRDKISKSLEKKIRKFAQFDELEQCYLAAMPLIAQLGKNFSEASLGKITGAEILNSACDKVQEIERLVGGKTTYIECNDEVKLIEFYSKASFVEFGSRNSTKNVEEKLIQMIKYF